MSNPILLQSYNQDFFNWSLSSAYRSGFRLWNPSFALAQDPEIIEKIQRDPKIQQGLRIRYTSVVGDEWAVTPFSDREDDVAAAAIVDELLNEMDRAEFMNSRYFLASAVFIGRAFCFMESVRLPGTYGEDTAPRMWWRPTRLRRIDERRFRWAPRRVKDSTGRERFDVALQMWSVAGYEWVDVANPECYVQVTFDDTEGRLGYGTGLLEAAFFYYYAKATVMKEGLQGLERWMQGLPIAKVDGASVGGPGQENETIRDAWVTVIQKMVAAGAVVMDKTDEFEVVAMSGTGYEAPLRWLDYLDRSILEVLTGTNLPAGGSSDKGSLARAGVEENTSARIYEFDRGMIDACLTRDVLQKIWRMNRSNFVAAGLGSARCPRFASTVRTEPDPTKESQIVSTILAAGVPLRRDEVYEKIGYTMPGPDDDVIDGRAQAQTFGIETADQEGSNNDRIPDEK